MEESLRRLIKTGNGKKKNEGKSEEKVKRRPTNGVDENEGDLLQESHNMAAGRKQALNKEKPKVSSEEKKQGKESRIVKKQGREREETELDTEAEQQRKENIRLFAFLSFRFSSLIFF